MKRKWAYSLTIYLIAPLGLGCSTGTARLPGLTAEIGPRAGLAETDHQAAGIEGPGRSDIIRGQTPAGGPVVSAHKAPQIASPQGQGSPYRQTAAHTALPWSHHGHIQGHCSACGGGGCANCSGGHRTGWHPTHYVWFDYEVPKNLVYPPANQPAAVVQYPYYTLKGPTDFFLE